MNAVYCFTSDVQNPDMFVHLKESPHAPLTLCGKKAMPPLRRERSKVTCDACRTLRPKQLGGHA